MTLPNEVLAKKASELARSSDGLTRRAASYAAMALSATETPADARSRLAELWQGDLRERAVDIIGWLAADLAKQ